MSCCDAGASPFVTYCVTAGTTAAASTAMTVTVTRISGSVKPLRRGDLNMSSPGGAALVGARGGGEKRERRTVCSVNRHEQELQRIDRAEPVADRPGREHAVVELAIQLDRGQRIVHRRGADLHRDGQH